MLHSFIHRCTDQVCKLDKVFTTQISDIDMALEERMDTVAQTIANGLHALETTATTVQTDLALLSTKQTLSSTKEKVWWAETKRSLVALQSDIMDDRATTTQCLRELRESMQAMTIMMGQMINLVQYHTTVPMMIDTHGGSSPTNAPTPTSQDESATAMILSNLTTTLSTIAVGQETLAGTIIKLNSAVTDMVATNQLQLQSTLAHLTTLTRESSDALAQQSQEDHIHTREMLTNMSESFKEVGITYRPVLQLSPPTTSPDQSKPPSCGDYTKTKEGLQTAKLDTTNPKPHLDLQRKTLSINLYTTHYPNSSCTPPAFDIDLSFTHTPA